MNEWMNMLPVFLAVKPGIIITIVVAVLLIGGLIALSIYGKKLQDKQEEAQKQMQAAAQNVSFLVIDKKRLKLKDSGLPSIVIEQTPKRFRGQKVPIVKAKVGPQIMSLMCDEKIFDLIPVKKTVKARVAGINILEVKGLHADPNAAGKKKSFRAKMQDRLTSLQAKAKTDLEKTDPKKDSSKKESKKKVVKKK